MFPDQKVKRWGTLNDFEKVFVHHENICDNFFIGE